MNSFRAPFFWLAVFALGLAVLVELGPVAALHVDAAPGLGAATPGWGIRCLAILDLVLLFGVATIGLGLILPRAMVGRLQGVVALVLSVLGCLAAISVAFLALNLLSLMVTLLVAPPFGTLIYLAAWGHFPTGSAQATLALIMFLKLVFCVLLLLAQQAFLGNKGLVVLGAVSLGFTWLVSFLIGFIPGFLVSIADIIAALVMAVVGVFWLAFLAIGSLFGIVSAIRGARA